MRNKSAVCLLLVATVAIAQAQTGRYGAQNQPEQSTVQQAPSPNLPQGGSALPPSQPTPGQVPVQQPVALSPNQPTLGQLPSPQPAPGPQPLVERNEFQQFVSASYGKLLPIFGSKTFEAPPTSFAPLDQVPVTSDYVIGPDDEIIMRAWGQVDIDYRTLVDRSGNVYIPKVGTVHLAGVRYDQIANHIKNAIGQNYHDFQLDVTMGHLRSIQVFVIGQAKQPGSYTVSSLSTMLNALFAAGGPSVNGSMRNIQLRRGNRLVCTLDLYDFLIKGDKSNDTRLLPGDVIFIPPVGDLVAIAGSVNVPAVYELNGKTTLGELLDMAGGMTATAKFESATIERINLGSDRSVKEVDFGLHSMSEPLRNGDFVNVHPVSERFTNAVSLRGSVAQPGRYEWHEGMRVADLLRDAYSLVPPRYWKTENRLTLNASSGDSPDQALLKTQLERISPDLNWDYAVVERLLTHELTTDLLTFNLRNALTDPGSSDNLLLRPGDMVTIFSQRDIQVPVGKRTIYVTLEGEVKAAGVYRAKPGETLRQVVERAGGLTERAYLFGSEFNRVAAREQQQKHLEEAVQQFQQDVERNAHLQLASTSDTTELAEYRQSIANQRQMVDRLRNLQVTGRVALEIEPNATDMKDVPDIPLEDGDRFYIPPQQAFVSVMGAVNNSASFLYRRDYKCDDYLRKAGGFSRLADKGNVFVLRADGTVMARNNRWLSGGLGSMKLMPGDTVVVPTQLTRTSFVKTMKDWTQILSQMGVGVAAVKLLTQ